MSIASTDLAAEAPAFDTYTGALREYFETRSEAALYRASLLSQTFVESGLGPEDIVALHFEALDQALGKYSYRDQARVIADAGQFLLEIMIAYGVRYKEYLEYRTRQSLQAAEAETLEAQRRALESDRLTRAKDEILAVIAHELRTPITAAMSTLELATRSLTSGQAESVPRHLTIIQEALERLSRLSADLVEASRGELPALAFVDVDIADIVGKACEWAVGLAAGRNVTISCECSAAAATCGVRANPDALLTIFGNLLSNAIRYTRPGGTVIVRCDLEPATQEVVVRVQDTGIGMSPEVQARVFEKFFRAPEAQAFEAQGLGLGLALVHQLVEVHDGRITVDSTPGAGSTFLVALPAPGSRKDMEARSLPNGRQGDEHAQLR